MKRYYPFIALGASLIISAFILTVIAFHGNMDADITFFRTGYTTAKGRHLGGAFICLIIGIYTLKYGWNGLASRKK